MASLLPFVLFINGDITYPEVPPPTPPVYIGAQYPHISEATHLQTQLFIDDTMTKAEFDARIAMDPNYATVVHLMNLRIMVILPTFQDLVNRDLADIVMFLSHGLANIERNRVGPTCKSFDIQRLNPSALLHAAKHANGECVLPFEAYPQCDNCRFPFWCDREHTFSGMRICKSCQGECKCGCNLTTSEGIRISPIHLPNQDNEMNNRAFLDRK